MRDTRPYPATSAEILGANVCIFADAPAVIDCNTSYDDRNAIRLRWVTFNTLRFEEAFICGGFSSLFKFEDVMQGIRNNISEMLPNSYESECCHD
jgi:hypothetical protein